MEGLSNWVLERNEAIAQVRLQRPAASSVYILRVGSWQSCGVLSCQLKGCIRIEVSETLNVSIRDNGNRMIANHLGGIAIPGRKDGKISALLPLFYQRSDHVPFSVWS